MLTFVDEDLRSGSRQAESQHCSKKNCLQQQQPQLRPLRLQHPMRNQVLKLKTVEKTTTMKWVLKSKIDTS
jgi:hypothetical protein